MGEVDQRPRPDAGEEGGEVVAGLDATHVLDPGGGLEAARHLRPDLAAVAGHRDPDRAFGVSRHGLEAVAT